MDLRGISSSHRRLKQAHDAVQFHSSTARDSHGRVENEEEHRGFRISYQQRKVGVTRSRTQFSAIVESDEPKLKMYLSGFASVDAARSAAHHKIDATIYRLKRQLQRTGKLLS